MSVSDGFQKGYPLFTYACSESKMDFSVSLRRCGLKLFDDTIALLAAWQFLDCHLGGVEHSETMNFGGINVRDSLKGPVDIEASIANMPEDVSYGVCESLSRVSLILNAS